MLDTGDVVIKELRAPGDGYLAGGAVDHLSPYPVTSVTEEECVAACRVDAACVSVVYTPDSGGNCYKHQNSYSWWEYLDAGGIGMLSENYTSLQVGEL